MFPYNTKYKQLQFKLHKDAPSNYKDIWKSIQEITGRCIKDRDNLAEEWKSKCKLPSNQNLPLLQRCEGIFGGNENFYHKQARFTWDHILGANDPMIRVILIDAKEEKWSMEEAEDLKEAFVIVLNKRLNDICVEGNIEIII